MVRGKPATRGDAHTTIPSKLRRSGAADREQRSPPLLPKFDYHLDESDPDMVVLRRQDGSFVAVFSASGATREGIAEAAEQDYAALVRENSGSVACAAEGPQSD